jgi:hypothetical protein
MSRDPVERVLDHNMQAADESAPKQGYDPIFNSAPVDTVPTAVRPYDPNHVDPKHFGRPATGDGK